MAAETTAVAGAAPPGPGDPAATAVTPWRVRPLLAGGGIRTVTVAAALGCSRVMVQHWADGARGVSLRNGSKGRRFHQLLRALAAAEKHRASARAEARLMEEEGHGERWKTTSEAGYGSAHQKTRELYEPLVEAGQAWCCETVCINPGGRWIPPGSKWHLAHTVDRSAYKGPAHEICNCSEAGRRANPKGKPKRKTLAPRRWKPTRAW